MATESINIGDKSKGGVTSSGCHQCKECQAMAPPAFNGPEKIVRHTMQEVKNKFGNETVVDLFGGSDKELSNLLGAEKWTEIKSAPL